MNPIELLAQAFQPKSQGPVGLAALPLGGSKPLYTFEILQGQNWIPLGGPWTAHNACLAIKWLKAHFDGYSSIYIYRWGSDFSYEAVRLLNQLPGYLPDVNLSGLNAC